MQPIVFDNLTQLKELKKGIATTIDRYISLVLEINANNPVKKLKHSKN